MAAKQDSPALPEQEDVKIETGVKTADAGPPNSPEMIERAEDLPEKDEVQKAYKDQLTAEDAQKEAKASLKIAEESPNAMETPSGHALKESAGESNDAKRGDKYARAKAEARWGWVPPEDF
jgi:uncharacterized protein YPO0396